MYDAPLLRSCNTYEGDPRRNANLSAISYTFGIFKNLLHVYYDILSIPLDPITF